MGKSVKIVAIIAILVGAFFLGKDYINRGVLNYQLTQSLSGARDTARQYKDLYGTTHSILEVTNLNHQSALILKDSLIRDQADRLKVKPRQITGHTSFVITKGGVARIDVDSLVKALKANKPIGDTSHEIAYIPFREEIGLKLNQFWKRKWFLGAKKYFIDVYSEDDGVKVYNFQSVHIADEYGPFAISLTGGIIVPDLKPALVIGLSWTPKFLRFKKRK